MSDEHFSVDGTLIEAWASRKSFHPQDGSDDHDRGANFHGQQRKNDTHASTTDPNCRLYRKAAGREARLCYMDHATMENRRGLPVTGVVTLANGTAERRASETMLKAKAKGPATASRWAKTRLMIAPTMWRSCALPKSYDASFWLQALHCAFCC